MANTIYKSVAINETDAGDKEIVAAVTGGKIQIHGLWVGADAINMTVKFESGAGGTALTGVIAITTTKFLSIPFSEVPWGATAAGAALSLKVTGTGDVDGVLIYSVST